MVRTETTTLTIRNVESRLQERLRIRAAQHGRSMEAELRQILADVLDSATVAEPDLATAIKRRMAPLGGIDDLPPHPPVPVGAPLAFDW